MQSRVANQTELRLEANPVVWTAGGEKSIGNVGRAFSTTSPAS